MTYQRFRQLWDTLVTDRAQEPTQQQIPANGMRKATSDALIALSLGDSKPIEEARQQLARLKNRV